MMRPRLTPDDLTAWSRAGRPLLRQWLSCWSGSALLHGAAMFYFVVIAQSGPQAWPVVRGRASVESAPSLDSRVGRRLARMSESAEPITIETITLSMVSPASDPATTKHSSEPDALPEFDRRSVAEIMNSPVTADAEAAIGNEFSAVVRQLNRIATDQTESQQIIAHADRTTIRDVDFNRPFSPNAAESREPSTREGNAEQDSKAAVGSSASRGADENEQPIKLASNPDPEYPEDAKAARQQGRVVLLIRVGADGRVESLKLWRSSGVKSLDDAALKTVKEWRFEPAKRLGRPIAMEVRHAIRFELQDK